MKQKMNKILGIDPGLKGAFFLSEPYNHFGHWEMPIHNKEPYFDGIRSILEKTRPDHIFIERAIPMAMGAKHAFNYGRGFAALEIAIALSKIPVTYVEPAKWQKALFDGIDSRLKPKERALIAIERLLPEVASIIPKGRTGRMHEGIVDAALIAHYGWRYAFGQQPKLSQTVDLSLGKLT
jgi:hypothetical protein